LRNVFLRIFQILTVVLIIALAASTFVMSSDNLYPRGAETQLVKILGLTHFYNSALNILLWMALSVTMLLSVFLKGMRSLAQKSMHLLLVMIILLVFYDKAVNQRCIMPIREGQEINLANFVKNPDPAYDIPLRLLKFDVRMHPGSSTPAAFTSRLLINRVDTTNLAVNEPIIIGRYKLYQSAYNRDYLLQVISGKDTLITPFNSKIFVNQQELFLHDFNDSTHTFRIESQGKEYRLPVGEVGIVAGQKVQIIPLGSKYTSIIEVADTTGVSMLALFAIVYIMMLAYNLWWKQPN